MILTVFIVFKKLFIFLNFVFLSVCRVQKRISRMREKNDVRKTPEIS